MWIRAIALLNSNFRASPRRSSHGPVTLLVWARITGIYTLNLYRISDSHGIFGLGGHESKNAPAPSLIACNNLDFIKAADE
jgi:hypothetical protein